MGDEADMRLSEDRWGGSITYYIDWMRERVPQFHLVLKPVGSLYLHCDWRSSVFGAGHELRER